MLNFLMAWWPWCCCPTTTTTTQPPGCGECRDEGVLEFTLTVSGVTNNFCAHCNNYNGTFTLTHDGGANCSWRSDFSPAICPNGTVNSVRQWVLTFTDALGWILDADSDGAEPTARYLLDVERLDCFGDNTFNLDSNTVSCSNWPATLTVSPAP